jgi:DNA-binding beta-propeller fold protein YncE
MIKRKLGFALAMVGLMVFASAHRIEAAPARLGYSNAITSIYTSVFTAMNSVQIAMARMANEVIEDTWFTVRAPTVRIKPKLIKLTQTFKWSSPSSDPAGIAYQPSTGHLLISDSEVEEYTRLYWHGVNVFQVSPTGNLVRTFTTFTKNPTSREWNNYSNEPSGLALNPANGHLFVADDVVKKIFEIDPADDAQLGTPDDQVTAFSTLAFGAKDVEDVEYANGVLYISDGSLARIYAIYPGANGIFDGVPPAGDDQVTYFDVGAFGVRDAEGLGYDPVSQHLLVVDKSRYIVEVTLRGTFVRAIDLSLLNGKNFADVVVAPSSVNPAVNSWYVVDRMLDNNTTPNENDGRLYELFVP